jgi:hypothetical protein
MWKVNEFPPFVSMEYPNPRLMEWIDTHINFFMERIWNRYLVMTRPIRVSGLMEVPSKNR